MVFWGWRAGGGPPVTAPTGEGFGSQLLDMSAVRQLGGRLQREWRPEGLAVTVTVPETSFRRA